MTRLRFLTFFGILIILFSIFPVITYAQSGQTFKVSSDSVNVRSKPLPDSEIIGKLSREDQLKVFNEHYGWVQTYYGGQEAWVAKHHLIPIGTSTHELIKDNTPNYRIITIQSDGVNIRSGPGEGYSIVASASLGETFPLLNSEREWHQIKLQNGTNAWVHSLYTNNQISYEVVDESTTNASNNDSLVGRHIVLDPGHGGTDPGAIGLYGTYEKNLTLSFAQSIAHSLRQKGATVTLTRDGDFFVPLERRAYISNSYETDIFLSIHFNAFPVLTAQGVSSYYYTMLGKNLADHIQTSLYQQVTLNNRGINYAEFHVLRNTRAPAALIELGFITNPYDYNLIHTNEYKQQVSQAITDGVIHYFH